MEDKKYLTEEELTGEKDKKYSIKDYFKTIGPGAVVTATIIGPGTVTTCTVAGVDFKYALIWAAVFATLTSMILQIISSRVGIASGKGLTTLLHDTFEGTGIHKFLIVALFLSIGIGNSAFQGGNMIGAVLGAQAIFPLSTVFYATIITIIATALLWSGKTDLIEKVMTILVLVMVVLFLVTAIVVRPNLGEIFKGLRPIIPKGGILTTIGVVGTTVIPHLLFMHSSLTAESWKGRNRNNALKESNFDTVFNLILCGIITISIIITGASMYGTGIVINSGLDMAKQLEPLVGTWAKYFFGLGLFAAGISSALSAPMSASYALCGIMGWSTDFKSKKFRIIMIAVLLAGFLVTASGYSPVTVIILAQAFNGVMLPLSAAILVISAANKKMLGKYASTTTWNVLGITVIFLTLILSARTLYNVFMTIF
jgi:manganese transport protein